MNKILILLLTALSFNVEANTEIINSKISFVATGRPSFIKAKGEMEALKADVKIENGVLKGELIVDLNNFNSGIELRDRHLKEKYLEVKKFQFATLKIKGEPVSFTKKKQKIKGILSLHGVDKEVSISLDKLKSISGVLDVNAEFNLNLKDYSIELPSFQGITAAKNVMIKTKMKLKL